MANKVFPFAWTEVITRLRAESLDTVIKVRVADIADPAAAGMRRIEPKGDDKRPQYALVLDENLALHVLACGDWYHVRLYVHRTAHLAATTETEVLDRDESPVHKRETRSSSLTKLVSDNPGLTLGLASGFGALLAASLASKKQRARAAANGAAVGLALGLTMVAVDTATTSPRTSEVAQALFATLASAGLAGRPASRIIRLGAPSRSTSATSATPKTKRKVKAKKAL